MVSDRLARAPTTIADNPHMGERECSLETVWMNV